MRRPWPTGGCWAKGKKYSCSMRLHFFQLYDLERYNLPFHLQANPHFFWGLFLCKPVATLMQPWLQVWKTAFIYTGYCIKLKKELELLTLKNGNNKLSRNFAKYQSTVRNIPEERRPNLNRGGNQKSRRTGKQKSCLR